MTQDNRTYLAAHALMKVVREYPPNIEDIKAHLEPGEHTVFTYGDTLYAPHLGVDQEIPAHLFAHEEIHAEQQKDPVAWWKQYVKDPQFRLEQELEAYGKQYQWAKTNLRSKYLKGFLFSIASDLAGPMYGNILTYQQAEQKIRTYGKEN